MNLFSLELAWTLLFVLGLLEVVRVRQHESLRRFTKHARTAITLGAAWLSLRLLEAATASSLPWGTQPTAVWTGRGRSRCGCLGQS